MPAPIGVAAQQPGAPFDLASVEATLRTASPVTLLDLGYGVTPELRTRLEARMRQFSGNEAAKAWVVAIPRTRNVEDLKLVFGDLGMHGRDTFIVFNGDKRHVHVGLLGKTDAEGVLAVTREAYRRNAGDGVIAMIDEVDKRLSSHANTPSTTVGVAPAAPGPKPGEARKGGVIMLVLLVAAVIAIAAWVATRRRKVDGAIGSDHAAAKALAESAVAELLLALEAIPRDEAISRALDRANALQLQLGSVTRQGVSRASMERLKSLAREANRMRAQLETPALPSA
jgi:hypothetical protein